MKSSPLLFLIPTAFALMAARPLNAEGLPSGGQSIVAPDALLGPQAKFIGKKFGSQEKVKVEGMPFSEAVRITTTQRPEKEYHVQIKAPLREAVKKGDVLLASFYARSVGQGHNETGLGQVGFVLMKRKSNETLGKFKATPGAEWQHYLVPMQAKVDAGADEAMVIVSSGAMLQTIDIGGVEIVNYGGSKSLADLPKTEITYAGREPDAAWRKAAQERIEQHRKADLTVVVKDSQGNVVPDADVQVNMTKHAFQFGAAITARAFEGSAATAPLLDNHKKLFNQGLPITSFVWNIYDKEKNAPSADRFLKYLKDNGMATRAHVLVWERKDVMPPDVNEMIKNEDKDALRARVSQYITDTVTRFKGRVDEWVVENEAVDNSEIRDVLGEASIAEWFKLARQADPDAKLMINENRVEGLKPDKSDRLLELVKIIESNGGKVDTIGIQGHFGSIPVPPETLLKHYDKLAATGKRLAITEYDFDSEDEQIKADYTRDALTAAFSHPSFDCFTLWRFWDGKPEKRESVIYAHDWTMRPSGKVFQDLVFNQWWTKTQGKTNSDGAFAARGFLGDYEITASANGKTGTAKYSLKKDRPNTIEVVLN